MKGPTKIRFEKETCMECEYHRAELFCSGRYPLRHHFCGNPEFELERWIGKSDGRGANRLRHRTPSMCPFKICAR